MSAYSMSVKDDIEVAGVKVEAAKNNGTASAKDAGGNGGGGRFGALQPFVIISSSYLLFTITDGAIRMIVLLHAYNLGFSALQVAIMFMLYEVAGVVTNLVAGLAGSRWGIRLTLVLGLILQLFGIGMLYAWQEDWSKAQGIVFVTFAQMLCGVAKDLTKLGGKTVTKLVTPEEKQTRLFRLVAFITGFKNSLKGAGYFLGAATVAVNYYLALSILIALILLALPWAVTGLKASLGRATGKPVTLRDVFKMNYNINVLSAARMFLFGSRDAWFEVPLPFFLRDDVFGLGWSRSITGLFLALFIIVYGQFQSWSPQLLLTPLRQAPANKYVELLWSSLLFVLPLVLGAVITGSDIFQNRDTDAMTAVLVAGIGIFCLIFAVNSAVHSYLVLRYSEGNKVAINVGFYYMSNAMGRLTGTMLSGVLYTYAGDNVTDGFGACFFLSAAFVAACVVITAWIKDDDEGLSCGPLTCVKGRIKLTKDADDSDDAASAHAAMEDGAKGQSSASEVCVEHEAPPADLAMTAPSSSQAGSRSRQNSRQDSASHERCTDRLDVVFSLPVPPMASGSRGTAQLGPRENPEGDALGEATSSLGASMDPRAQYGTCTSGPDGAVDRMGSYRSWLKTDSGPRGDRTRSVEISATLVQLPSASAGMGVGDGGGGGGGRAANPALRSYKLEAEEASDAAKGSHAEIQA